MPNFVTSICYSLVMDTKSLRARRRAVNLTAQQLATNAGISIGTIFNAEKGVNVPYPETCAKIEAALIRAERELARQNAA